MRQEQTLKEYVIHLCKLHNIGLYQFTKQININKQNFNRILNGHSMMSLKTYFKVCEGFSNISIYPEEYFLKRMKQYIQKELNNE